MLTLAGVPICANVICNLFGVEEQPTPNVLDCDNDYSELRSLAAPEWPLAATSYGSEFLVPPFSSPDKSTVRREMGFRLLPAALDGLANVDTSKLVPSANDPHAARGRGIELVVWQAVLGNDRSKFGVRIGSGQFIRRKGASATDHHRFGVVVALVQQTDAGASYAKWLPGLWVVCAMVRKRGEAASAASATNFMTEIVLLPRRSVEVVPSNLDHLVQSFESRHNAGDGAAQMAMWRTQPEFEKKVNEWLEQPTFSDSTAYSWVCPRSAPRVFL